MYLIANTLTGSVLIGMFLTALLAVIHTAYTGNTVLIVVIHIEVTAALLIVHTTKQIGTAKTAKGTVSALLIHTFT